MPYANQQQQPSNQSQQYSQQTSQHNPEIPITLENQQGIQVVIQILQEQHKTIQKMAQEIAWLKTQQQSKNEALNATYFATPSRGRGR
ncbi:hypothetical protein [Helicobacter labacensis]|uniref:hypothetical protein n=1 Tax=Helicobacter labacensis TaxID=2316079 RepID=UPI000EB3C22E|nr:hypothetical protein [Helicobacter labacensis]